MVVCGWCRTPSTKLILVRLRRSMIRQCSGTVDVRCHHSVSLCVCVCTVLWPAINCCWSGMMTGNSDFFNSRNFCEFLKTLKCKRVFIIKFVHLIYYINLCNYDQADWNCCQVFVFQFQNNYFELLQFTLQSFMVLILWIMIQLTSIYGEKYKAQ